MKDANDAQQAIPAKKRARTRSKKARKEEKAKGMIAAAQSNSTAKSSSPREQKTLAANKEAGGVKLNRKARRMAKKEGLTIE